MPERSPAFQLATARRRRLQSRIAARRVSQPPRTVEPIFPVKLQLPPTYRRSSIHLEGVVVGVPTQDEFNFARDRLPYLTPLGQNPGELVVRGLVRGGRYPVMPVNVRFGNQAIQAEEATLPANLNPHLGEPQVVVPIAGIVHFTRGFAEFTEMTPTSAGREITVHAAQDTSPRQLNLPTLIEPNQNSLANHAGLFLSLDEAVKRY